MRILTGLFLLALFATLVCSSEPRSSKFVVRQIVTTEGGREHAILTPLITPNFMVGAERDHQTLPLLKKNDILTCIQAVDSRTYTIVKSLSLVCDGHSYPIEGWSFAPLVPDKEGQKW